MSAEFTNFGLLGTVSCCFLLFSDPQHFGERTTREDHVHEPKTIANRSALPTAHDIPLTSTVLDRGLFNRYLTTGRSCAHL